MVCLLRFATPRLTSNASQFRFGLGTSCTERIPPHFIVAFWDREHVSERTLAFVLRAQKDAIAKAHSPPFQIHYSLIKAHKSILSVSVTIAEMLQSQDQRRDQSLWTDSSMVILILHKRGIRMQKEVTNRWINGYRKLQRCLWFNVLQQSLVILTHHQYPALFSVLASRLGPLYQNHGIPIIETACHSIANWYASRSVLHVIFPNTLTRTKGFSNSGVNRWTGLLWFRPRGRAATNPRLTAVNWNVLFRAKVRSQVSCLWSSMRLGFIWLTIIFRRS
jgi:hypothetical protein